jgi:hypothetical protein
MAKTRELFIPAPATIKSLRRVLKKGDTLQMVSVNTGRSRGLPSRAFVPVALRKGKVVNLSSEITDLLNVKWADDDSIRSFSDPYHLTRQVSSALYGDPSALTLSNVSC